MKRFLGMISAVVVCLALATGCEWTGGGGVESWSDSYNWVNFSGVYRGAGNGYLVSDYSSIDTAHDDSHSIYETVGVGSTARNYSGQLTDRPVTAGTVLITVGEYSFDDDGVGGLIGNVSGSSGSIIYETGGWSITLPASSDINVDATVTRQVGTGSNSRDYSGTVGSTVVAGTFTISIGGYSFQDDGAGKLNGAISGSSGTITYETGAWSISLPASGSGGSTVSENIGTGSASQRTYAGQLSQPPLVGGSLTISVGSYSFVDTGSETLTGNITGSSGTINYDTGSWAITLPDGGGDGSTVTTSENLGTGTATDDVYYGELLNKPVAEGTLRITAGDYVFVDNGENKLIEEGGAGTEGTIIYETGAWSIEVPLAIPGESITAIYEYQQTGSSDVAGKSITAVYQTVTTSSDVNGEAIIATWQASGDIPTADVNGLPIEAVYSASTVNNRNANPGSSGITVYSFSVWQAGNVIQITDNNGSVYEGNLGSVSGSLDLNTQQQGTPVNGDVITAQFEAQGISAAGYTVTIAGTLQGIVIAQGSGYYLNNPLMEGTWIEDGGVTGSVSGQAPSSNIDPATYSSSGQIPISSGSSSSGSSSSSSSSTTSGTTDSTTTTDDTTGTTTGTTG